MLTIIRHSHRSYARGDDMAGSQTSALGGRAPAIAQDQEVRLSLPEATMFIIGSSGVLWLVLYGAVNALLG
jgi:hypothetical protein